MSAAEFAAIVMGPELPGRPIEPPPALRFSVLGVAAGIVAGVLMAVGVAAIWNPWRLVILDQFTGWLPFLVGIGIAGVVLRGMCRDRWIAVPFLSMGVGSLLLAAVLVSLLIAVRYLMPFSGEELNKQTVDLGHGISVVRQEWTSGALHSCVTFEVRDGSGLLTRHGSPTRCRDVSHDQGWTMTAAGDNVILTYHGARCLFAVDEKAFDLVPIDAERCPPLRLPGD